MQQSTQRTVGDTFTVVHRVAIVPGSIVQPRLPTDTALVTVLGAPAVTREGDSVRIAYSLAVWAPGNNELVIPGAIVVGRDGGIDTLPDARVLLDVASVLPRDTAVTAIQPRALRPWIARGDVSWTPFLVLLPLVALAAAAGAWLRRRRGPPVPGPSRSTLPPADPERLERWLAAGESRLVLAHLEAMLRERADAERWLGDVEQVRFAPADAEQLVRLAHDGLALLAARSR